jgi:hypothetical protein
VFVAFGLELQGWHTVCGFQNDNFGNSQTLSFVPQNFCASMN